jgi:hypothetical protein
MRVIFRLFVMLPISMAVALIMMPITLIVIPIYAAIMNAAMGSTPSTKPEPVNDDVYCNTCFMYYPANAPCPLHTKD